jgi:signal transduction histidine kinase
VTRWTSPLGCLHVDIEDDGHGFDSSVDHSEDRHHFGLIGMRERVESAGGEFHLTSSPGKGTQVHLSIPLASSPR